MISVEYSGDIMKRMTLLISVPDNRFLFWRVVNARYSWHSFVPLDEGSRCINPLYSQQGPDVGFIIRRKISPLACRKMAVHMTAIMDYPCTLNIRNRSAIR